MEDGKGVLRRGGRWRLTLLDTADERQAIALVDALVNAGYPAQVLATVGAARSAAYRVRIDGFPGEAEAKVVAARLASFEGVRNTRIER